MHLLNIYILSILFIISLGFWFFSEDQVSKASENTENRKEPDEVSNTKSSSQIPTQPSVAKGPYGKGPPFNQVCGNHEVLVTADKGQGWINLIIIELEKDLGNGNYIFFLKET